MKRQSTIPKCILRAGMACALALTAWLPVTLHAQQGMKPMKGGEHLVMLTHISTTNEAQALKPGDTIAMVCNKCKSVMVHNVTTEKGHISVMTVGEKHLCPGCGSTITTVGFGKGKHNEVKHTCDKCGDNSVFCCATKPGSNPTAGMAEEKK
jgi:hypothetical protein